MAATALAQEKIWVDKPSYDKAERLFHERAAKVSLCVFKFPLKNKLFSLKKELFKGNDLNILN